MGTDPALPEFLAVSAALGNDSRQVQGPGGNTSLKLDGSRMLVKASGFELAFALTEPMFTEVDFARVRSTLASGAADPLLGAFDPSGLRPSIETTFHALMPHRVVLHTHAIPVVAASCRLAAREFLGPRLSGLGWVLVEYARPGTPLGRLVAEALAAAPGASVLVLGNHGLVVGADTPAKAHELLRDVTARLEVQPRKAPGRGEAGALAGLAAKHGLTLPEAVAVGELARDPVGRAIAAGGTLYPDHVVFLGSGAGLLEERSLGAEEDPFRPRLWMAAGIGALLEPELPRAAQALARCLADVVALLPDATACRYLSRSDEAELLGMDEEKHRQSLAKRMR